MKLTLLFLSLLFMSPFASATFGLGPCCSGAICGIIPCDNECAGVALVSWGSNMSSGLSNSATTFDNLTKKTKTVGTNFVEFYSKATNSATKLSVDVLAGLDAMASKIEFSIMAKQKSLEAMYNTTNSILHEAYSHSSLVKKLIRNTAKYGEYAQSVSARDLLNESKERVSLGITEQESRENLMQYVEQILLLQNDSVENDWSKRYKDKIVDTSFLLAEANTGIAAVIADPKEIAFKLANTLEGREITLSSYALSNTIAESLPLREEFPISVYAFDFNSSLSGISNIKNLNAVATYTHYGLNRELSINNALKTRQLNRYLSMIRATNVSAVGVSSK